MGRLLKGVRKRGWKAMAQFLDRSRRDDTPKAADALAQALTSGRPVIFTITVGGQ